MKTSSLPTAVLKFNGEVMIYKLKCTCYKCIYTKFPRKWIIPSSYELDILESIASPIGAIQANETIKFLIVIGAL